MCDERLPYETLRNTFIEAESVTFEVHDQEFSSFPAVHEHVMATSLHGVPSSRPSESGNSAVLHIRRLDYDYMYTVVAVAVMAQVREINSLSRRTEGWVRELHETVIEVRQRRTALSAVPVQQISLQGLR